MEWVTQVAIPALGVIAVIFGSVLTFKAAKIAAANASDANTTDRFEALINAQSTIFDRQVSILQAQINELKTELESVKAIDRAKTIELQKLREAVQRWFRSLRTAWKSVTEAPMPYPPDGDLELLGIRTDG